MNNSILVINPPNVPFSSHVILIEPIDTLHISSYIKSLGYSVTFLDMDVKKLLASEIQSYIKELNPKIVLIVFDYHIPLHDAGANQEIYQICQIARSFNITTILGGKAATFYSEDQLKTLGADIFIQHDMEEPLKNILPVVCLDNTDLSLLSNFSHIRYFKNNDFINTNNSLTNKSSFNLNDYPIPERSLINLNDYIDVRTILSSRGCNLKCSFCHVPGFWGNWQGRTPEHVVEEIYDLVNNYQARKILFLDDNAMAQPKRMQAIAQLIIDKKIKTRLGCLGTIISFKEEVFKTMYEAGFRWIHYGIESADNSQLKEMGKKITADQALEVIQETHNIGFRVRTSWILDMPNLTEEGLLKTEKMIIENPTEEIRLHFLTLRLGSRLFQEYMLDTPQFIHNSKPNLNISGVTDEMILESVQRILAALVLKGYTVVRNPDDFIDINQLKQHNPTLKIVSLCPLRYGLGWEF